MHALITQEMLNFAILTLSSYSVYNCTQKFSLIVMKTHNSKDRDYGTTRNIYMHVYSGIHTSLKSHTSWRESGARLGTRVYIYIA